MQKKKEKNQNTTRQLLHIRELLDYCLRTDHGDLVFFLIKPSNLAVLSENSIRARIHALMHVLKGIADVELYCLNSRESFEENRQFLRLRLEQESNAAIRKLLEYDLTHLDTVQVQMATAREFLILVRLTEDKESEVPAYISRIEKSLGEQGFTVRRADRDALKSILAIYFEQNVTTEKFEDFDGERWTILNA